MAKIFINYRRKDSAPYAGRLYDRLAGHFGPDHVFMDIDQIEPGEVFDQVIQEKLKAVHAAVVLIGEHWLDIADADGQRRLDHPDDWVRLEIAAVLERDIRVIPVLVGGAAMPKSTQLPESLAPLTRRQAIEITDHRFHTDTDKLIKALGRIVGVSPPPPPESLKKKEKSNKSSLPRFVAIAGVTGLVLAAGVYFGGMPSKPMPVQPEMENQVVEPIAAVAPAAETQPVSTKAPVMEQPQAIIPTPASTPVIEQSVKIEPETKQSVDSSPAETNSATTKESIAVLPQQTMFTATDQLTQKIPPVMRKPVLESRNEESPVEKKIPTIEQPKVTVIEPEMVRIPSSKFLMGSPITDANAANDERPQHEVTINYGFEIGKYEVTFDEYDAFASATNRKLPRDKDWGRGKRPVIDVSFDDAQAYVQWLSKQTGRKYRLPTEAEWEYAARAFTQVRYYWGGNIGKNNANCGNCDSQWDNRQAAPVGSFKPNAFGLHDTAGNVREWVQDCWHQSYHDAPDDGSAWLDKNDGDCRYRVVRGGSWADDLQILRSAFRLRFNTGRADDLLGFRIVRDF